MEILFVTAVILAVALAAITVRNARPLPKRSGARFLAVLFVGVAVPLMVFAGWGLFTAAGRRAFDEMDALYPLTAGILGVLLTMLAALTSWAAARRREAKPR